MVYKAFYLYMYMQWTIQCTQSCLMWDIPKPFPISISHNKTMNCTYVCLCVVEPIYGSVPGDLDKKGLEELPLLESTMDGSHLNS